MNPEEQFKQLFHRNYNLLCNIAYNYLLDRDFAEDVVQETFIKFWRSTPSQLTSEEADYYLRRAIKNNCISELRKKRHHLSIDETFELSLSTTYDEEVHQENEKVELLHQLIHRLPAKCREVFLLNKFHFLKYREIAQRLNISIKTVENHMMKAISILRAAFQSKYNLLIFILLMAHYIFL